MADLERPGSAVGRVGVVTFAVAVIASVCELAVGPFAAALLPVPVIACKLLASLLLRPVNVADFFRQCDASDLRACLAAVAGD